MIPIAAPPVTSTTKHTAGSCLCGRVRYILEGTPLSIRVCHCVNCKKATGSAFMVNSFWQKDSFRVAQGAQELKKYADADTASGVPINRFFCGTCGSNVYVSSTRAKSPWVIVGLGTFDVDWKHLASRGRTTNDLDAGCTWVPNTEMFPEQRNHWIKGIETRSAHGAVKHRVVAKL